MRIHLLRDRHARVAEDLRQLEDVATRREEETRERVPQVEQAELLVDAGAQHRRLEWTEHTRLVARHLFAVLVDFRTGPEQRVLALRELHLAQHREHGVKDRDVTKAAGLGRSAASPVHVDYAMGEVDVDPHQVQRFVEAHASADQDRDERPDVVVTRGEKLLNFASGLQPAERALGDFKVADELERVLGAPALLDEVAVRGGERGE